MRTYCPIHNHYVFTAFNTLHPDRVTRNDNDRNEKHLIRSMVVSEVQFGGQTIRSEQNVRSNGWDIEVCMSLFAKQQT